MQRLSAFLILLFILPVSLLAQQKLTGVVVEKSTNTPVAYATVQAADSKSTLTNTNGEFELTIPSLPAKVTVSHLNYVGIAVQVTTAAQTLHLTVDPKTLTLKEVSVGNPALAIMQEASDKAQLNAGNSYYRKGFLRQTAYAQEKPSYVNELYFDGEWKSDGLKSWNLLEARRLADKEGISYDNTSFFSFIFSGYLPNSDLKKPLFKKVDSLYSFKLAGTYEQDGQEIAKISCTPKPKVKGLRFEGTYYVNTVTNNVLKIDGLIKGLVFSSSVIAPIGIKNLQTVFIAQYKLNKAGDNVLDYSVLNLMNQVRILGIGVKKTDLYSTLYMTADEDIDQGKLKTLEKSVNDNKLVKAIAYHEPFWKQNQGIKRTEKEQAAIEILEKIPQVKK